jgi:hypothetical protein
MADGARALAVRLRELRLHGNSSVTPRELATAFGTTVKVILSWENTGQPTTPPIARIKAYASYFAARSAAAGEPVDHLAEEQARRQLEVELLELRSAAPIADAPDQPAPATGPLADLWHFPDGAPVSIVCGTLPPDLQVPKEYSDPASPDYVELYGYADLDALVELYGHVRAVNPTSEVHFHRISYRVSSEESKIDLATHVVLLGGVDWNALVGEVLDALRVPVRQANRRDVSDVGLFEVDGQEFRPTVRETGGMRVLVEDVAHFVRGPNPWNRLRTLTICNGNYGRGTLGAVRALTDIDFRDRNTRHVRAHFPTDEPFSILSRVKVVHRGVITPDWTHPEVVLHTWTNAAPRSS